MAKNTTPAQELEIRKRKSKIRKYLGIVFILCGLMLFVLFCAGTLRINVNPFVALGSATLGVILGAAGGVILYDSRENLVIHISNRCRKKLQESYPGFSFSCQPVAIEVLQECRLFHPGINHNLDGDDEYSWLLHGKFLGRDLILSQVRCGNMSLCNGGWTGPILFEGLFIKIELETGVSSPVLAFTSAWGKQFAPPRLLQWPAPPYPLQASDKPHHHNFTVYSTELERPACRDLHEELLREIGNTTTQEVAIGIYPRSLYVAISWRWTKLPSEKITIDTIENYLDLQNNIMTCCKNYIQKCSGQPVPVSGI